jgi:hypothetical protein
MFLRIEGSKNLPHPAAEEGSKAGHAHSLRQVFRKKHRFTLADSYHIIVPFVVSSPIFAE